MNPGLYRLRYGLIVILLTNLLYAQASTTTDIQNNINKLMQSMCEQKQFSGAVLVAIDEKIIFKNSCGFANRSFDVLNNTNTKFNLGSVGKLFTSIASAQLILRTENVY